MELGGVAEATDSSPWRSAITASIAPMGNSDIDSDFGQLRYRLGHSFGPAQVRAITASIAPMGNAFLIMFVIVSMCEGPQPPSAYPVALALGRADDPRLPHHVRHRQHV